MLSPCTRTKAHLLAKHVICKQTASLGQYNREHRTDCILTCDLNAAQSNIVNSCPPQRLGLYCACRFYITWQLYLLLRRFWVAAAVVANVAVASIVLFAVAVIVTVCVIMTVVGIRCCSLDHCSILPKHRTVVMQSTVSKHTSARHNSLDIVVIVTVVTVCCYICCNN